MWGVVCLSSFVFRPSSAPAPDRRQRPAVRHPAAEQVAVGGLGEGGGAGEAVVVPAVEDQGFANAQRGHIYQTVSMLDNRIRLSRVISGTS
jgi:hypothetical protein